MRMATFEVHERREDKEDIDARASASRQIGYGKKKVNVPDDYETSSAAPSSSSWAMASAAPASMDGVAGALPLPLASERGADMRDVVGALEVRARRVDWPLRGLFAGGGFSGSSSILCLDA